MSANWHDKNPKEKRMIIRVLLFLISVQGYTQLFVGVETIDSSEVALTKTGEGFNAKTLFFNIADDSILISNELVKRYILVYGKAILIDGYFYEEKNTLYYIPYECKNKVVNNRLIFYKQNTSFDQQYFMGTANCLIHRNVYVKNLTIGKSTTFSHLLQCDGEYDNESAYSINRVYRYDRINGLEILLEEQYSFCDEEFIYGDVIVWDNSKPYIPGRR